MAESKISRSKRRNTKRATRRFKRSKNKSKLLRRARAGPPKPKLGRGRINKKR